MAGSMRNPVETIDPGLVADGDYALTVTTTGGVRTVALSPVTAGDSLTRWEVLMVDGLPVSTPDGSDWLYVEVPV